MGIRSRYELQLEYLKLQLVKMCYEVENAIDRANVALVEKDKDLAKKVADNDVIIDKLEYEIEQSCLKILLLEHPVAGDFKEISAILKMITDLERIGDQAADICNLILSFGDEKYFKEIKHLPEMSKIVKGMVKDSIHAYVNLEGSKLDEIEARDDEVDRIFDEIKRELIDFIKKDSSVADQAILFMMIAKYLERIGDHATNICEWTELCISGSRKSREIKKK